MCINKFCVLAHQKNASLLLYFFWPYPESIYSCCFTLFPLKVLGVLFGSFSCASICEEFPMKQIFDFR